MALTEMQTLILWALLAKSGGASFQKDLRPEVKKADREALVRAGLIATEKKGRPGLWLEISDKGWRWAAENLDADLPKRSTAGSAILQAWLTQLKAFMEMRGVALADILGLQHPSESFPTQPIPEPPPRVSPDYDTLRGRIRKAYLELSSNCLNTRVLLKDIRETLRDVDRVTLDDALKRMHLEEGTTLSGLNNPQEVTHAIRDAGLSFKGESMYVLWITK
jgi:hypothetical protein